VRRSVSAWCGGRGGGADVRGVPEPGRPGRQSRGRGQPVGPAGASCVEQYSPDTLRNRAFAFDGTVVSIELRSDSKLQLEGEEDPRIPWVTFSVHRWDRGGSGDEVGVWVENLNIETSAGTIRGEPGTRLLVAGEPRWGGERPSTMPSPGPADSPNRTLRTPPRSGQQPSVSEVPGRDPIQAEPRRVHQGSAGLPSRRSYSHPVATRSGGRPLVGRQSAGSGQADIRTHRYSVTAAIRGRWPPRGQPGRDRPGGQRAFLRGPRGFHRNGNDRETQLVQ
jgi:hypothetical protein